MTLQARWRRPLQYIFLISVAALVVTNVSLLFSANGTSVLYAEWLPPVSSWGRQRVGQHEWERVDLDLSWDLKDDQHPIGRFRRDADAQFAAYDTGRSRSFKAAVERYRSRYGRHPPPGYKEVCLATFILLSSPVLIEAVVHVCSRETNSQHRRLRSDQR